MGVGVYSIDGGYLKGNYKARLKGFWGFIEGRFRVDPCKNQTWLLLYLGLQGSYDETRTVIITPQIQPGQPYLEDSHVVSNYSYGVVITPSRFKGGYKPGVG